MLDSLHFKRRRAKYSIQLAALALFALSALEAQQPLPAPNAVQPGKDASSFTLHTGANLVVLDIVVTDSSGRPIHNLKADDFSVSENGKRQAVRNFQEHVAAAPQAGTDAAKRLPPGLFTNYSPAAVDGPANVLLLDMLNTPLRDQAHARAQIVDYLNHVPAGQQIAIFGLSSKLTILQGFTSDPAILKVALAKKSATKGSSLLDDAVGGGGGDGADATAISDSLASLGNTPDIQEAVANAQQFEADTQSFRFELRAQMTLDAMNELGRYLANIPGRKNLIWFSGSFPVSILPDPSINNGFANMASSEEEFRETTDLLARARVALYPVDARGLMNSNTFSVTSSGSKYVKNPAAAGKDEAKFDQQREADNDTMLQSAADTGGRAFVNTNALSDALGKAIEDGSNYYTLTFSPTDKNWDGRYRKIEVSLQNKAYQLSYRRGYYADDPDSPSKRAIEARLGPEDSASKSLVSRTMVRGAPVPSQIQFTVRVRPATGLVESVVAPANKLAAANPEAAPPFVRYAVDFAIDPRGFMFSQSDGSYRDAIQFITFLYDQEGNLVNRAGATLHADLKGAVYANFVQHPFSYNQDISVPSKGSFFLRIAVVDEDGNRAGAVEVPVDSVKGLAPLSTEAASPTTN